MLVLSLVLAGCAPEPGAGDSSTEYALEPACPDPVRPPDVSADLVNRVVAHADLAGWQAGDIGASARLDDGRLVWVFGDTVRRPELAPRLVANSMLISSGTCVSQVVSPSRGPVVPDLPNGVVHWPMSVVVVPSDTGEQVIVVLYARTRRGEGAGTLDFEFRGTTAAVFTVGRSGVPQVDRLLQLTPDDGDAQQINWGAAATVEGRWFYAYGTRVTGEPFVFGRELYVARAPVSDPATRETWQFWDGDAWQERITRAAPVLAAMGGVSQTLSVDVVDGRWVAVSKRDGDLGDFVYTWSAPGATGPWVPRRALHAPAGYDSGELTYAPLAHPDVPLSSGNLLVSISRNTTDPGQLFADPEVGRPVFVEIPPA